MPRSVIALLLVAAAAAAWDCPACGAANAGPVCTRCFLPEVPAGMSFVPACSVVLDGDTVDVAAFFVDSSPVTYRRILPWMNSTITTAEQLAAAVGGLYDTRGEFLSYTPFTSAESGGLTVPSACFDLPAGSFTVGGAGEFLASEGRRLPSAAELEAAYQAGLVPPVDTYEVMESFASVMEASIGPLLGTLSTQAMFAGFSSPSERVIWEWTSDVTGSEDIPGPCAVIFRPSGTGVALGGSGYFNVMFRGAVTLPSSLAGDS